MTRTLRTTLAALFAAACFGLPLAASAASLTSAQVSAIVGLLQAFGVDSATVEQVQQILGGDPPASGGSVLGTASSTTPITPHVPVTGSVYRTSSIGYDLSFNTTQYPTIPFGFGVVGVTGGKAFVHNTRLAYEYSWAQVAANGPTLYMNLNAPYGSTVTGHVSAPKSCATSVSITGAEPTFCEGYNYGYNAAADSYAYAQTAKVYPTLWWLDIEEANSWSSDTSVNDATIQGALDYLNSKGLKVGIYSVPYMWKAIAGEGFTPTETVNGSPFSVPTWFPIGVATQVGATNACNTKTSFIPGSPVWLLQYELDSTSIDQNIAC